MKSFNPLSRITSFRTQSKNRIQDIVNGFQSPFEDYILPDIKRRETNVRRLCFNPLSRITSFVTNPKTVRQLIEEALFQSPFEDYVLPDEADRLRGWNYYYMFQSPFEDYILPDAKTALAWRN